MGNSDGNTACSRCYHHCFPIHPIDSGGIRLKQEGKEALEQGYYFAMTLVSGMAFISALTRLQGGGPDWWWILAGFCATMCAVYNKKSKCMQSLIDVEAVPLKTFWLLLKNDKRRRKNHV